MYKRSFDDFFDFNSNINYFDSLRIMSLRCPVTFDPNKKQPLVVQDPSYNSQYSFIYRKVQKNRGTTAIEKYKDFQEAYEEMIMPEKLSESIILNVVSKVIEGIIEQEKTMSK